MMGIAIGSQCSARVACSFERPLQTVSVGAWGYSGFRGIFEHCRVAVASTNQFTKRRNCQLAMTGSMHPTSARTRTHTHARTHTHTHTHCQGLGFRASSWSWSIAVRVPLNDVWARPPLQLLIRWAPCSTSGVKPHAKRKA